MTATFFALFYSFGFAIFLLGMQSLLFFPLTLAYENWKRRALRALSPFSGKVSVIVPAYNEERTLLNTLQTLLESDYPNLEIIVVNDGSTDQTEACIADLIANQRITYFRQDNAGKAAALNRGIAAATGEIILYTDADSLFLPDTVRLMARWFSDPTIDAVCGNDMPLYPQNAIHRFLSITTHIGTGFVRRALSVIGCLQIISGNLGAIRKRTLDEIGGFKSIWGEDLEITFRLHQHGKRIIFDPQPKVLAECPGTLGALWRQRVRWIRSYLKIVLLHKGLFFSWRHRPFSWYLPINFLNMGVVPLLQTALLLSLPVAYQFGLIQFNDIIDVLIYVGFFVFIAIAIYSILLDRAYQDLKLLPYGLLILPISYFYNLVVIYSWWKEILQAEETWHKSERRDLQHAQPRVMRRTPALLALLTIFVGAAGYLLFYSPDQSRFTLPGTSAQQKNVQPQFHLAVSTHFDAWPDWKDAIKKITARPMIKHADLIGIGAGRAEWAYFKWAGHESDWSNHQKGETKDLLQTATDKFHAQGAQVVAMIDMFAPKYIADHPGTAAARFDGAPSTEQTGLVELTQGGYGKKILSMIEYLAANYSVDIISLTEIPYYSYSYNTTDLESYRHFSGQRDWPRNTDGSINRDHPTIWAWKNSLMEAYLAEVSTAVHRHGKLLYVDVPVSWKNFADEGKESGLDYRRVLKHADRIVLWNYYFLEGKPPEISRDLSAYMLNHFPADAYYISIGLWGKSSSADASSLGKALDATQQGGSKHIWITPNDLLSEAHWNEILRHWLKNEGH